MYAIDLYLLVSFICLDKSGASPDEYSAQSLSTFLHADILEIQDSIIRCTDIRLCRKKIDGSYSVYRQGLYNIIVHAAQYIFPVKVSGIELGIPTTYSSQGIKKHIITAGDDIQVWPTTDGEVDGYGIKPIHPGVTTAVKGNTHLYEMLAAIDSIRVGRSREKAAATQALRELILD